MVWRHKWDHNLSSPYTTSQTLETSADTAIMRLGVPRQNLQYSDIQECFKNHETQHAKNTFENRFSIPLIFTLKCIILRVQISQLFISLLKYPILSNFKFHYKFRVKICSLRLEGLLCSVLPFFLL